MAGVHEDFGEKIGGAKKDLWKDRGLYADDLEAMNEREAEKFVKKDNVWKKPDYAAMLEEGIPLGVVYFIKKARDGLNASPQYYRTDDTPEKRTARQKEYIKTVRELQAVLSDVRTAEDAVRAYDRFFVDNGYLEKVQGWGSGIHYRATKKGQDNPVITNKLSNTMLIRSAEYFERNFAQKAKKEQFCVSKEQKIPKGYAIHFNDGKQTYSKNGDWKPGTYYVTKGYSILRTNFETKEAALKWVQELAKGRNKNGKIRFVPPQLAHVKRTGPDYRNGVEITGQHYLDTFGFRGGEFGNWMNQNDRQTSLNMGFEALKDLASALKISDAPGDHPIVADKGCRLDGCFMDLHPLVEIVQKQHLRLAGRSDRRRDGLCRPGVYFLVGTAPACGQLPGLIIVEQYFPEHGFCLALVAPDGQTCGDPLDPPLAVGIILLTEKAA